MSPEIRRRRRSRGLRHLRRSLRRFRQHRPRATVILALFCLALIALVWCIWSVWSVARDLREVERQAQVMRAALIRGDADGARRALVNYQDAAQSARSRTDGPTWTVFGALPVVGDDANGVAVVSQVLDGIGRDGLPPVIDAADEVTADAFQPTDHVFPLGRIAAMEKPAAQSEAAFASAANTLSGVDSSGFVEPIRSQFDVLRALVQTAGGTLGSTYRASRLMPALLGGERPHHYLLVMQNNAEARSSGGLPGSLSLVRTDRGEVRIVEQVDMASLEKSKSPVLPLTAEERRVFGRILGIAGVDATLTPDFPRASDLIRARWERFRGGKLDGVFFVDPVAVSYLLQGTGPVPVAGADPVSADNVVSRVENEIYRATSDTDLQSDYQNAVAKSVFNAFADGQGDTVVSIRGLAAAVMEGRVRMHFFGAPEQAEIAGTQIAGEFGPQHNGRLQVGIYINDGGPTKMQYYLRHDAALFARSCVGGRQELTGSIDFHSATPPDAATLPPGITGASFPGVRVDPGDQLLVVYLTSPVGGEVTELALDGQKIVDPVVESFAGRGLARVGIHLEPGQRQRLSFGLRGGQGEEGDIELAVTPGAFPGSSNGTVDSACRAR